MSRFYGVTHDDSGELSAKVPRVVKVSIGLPKGKDIHVLVGPNKKWYVCTGEKKEPVETKELAKELFKQRLKTAGDRRFPKKIAYFTFTRNNAEGTQEPDFDLIGHFGALPTELDVVFFNNSKHYNFERGMKMYSKSKLLCHGNGLDALRDCSIAKTPEEKKLAADAQKAGEKYFSIINGCYSRGCSYAKEQDGKPAACKPHGTLRFQLAKSLMLGGDCYLTTTSLRSISNLEAMLDQLYSFAGQQIIGIPLLMQLRPYNTPKGTSYSITLTMSAESQVALVRKIQSGSTSFKQIQAPVEDTQAPVFNEQDAAQSFHAEFVVAVDDEDGIDEAPPPDAEDGIADVEYDEPFPQQDKPATQARFTLDGIEQIARDSVLQLGRKLAMNRAKIEAFLGGFNGTIDQAIAQLANEVEAKGGKV